VQGDDLSSHAQTGTQTNQGRLKEPIKANTAVNLFFAMYYT